jgi:trafficking protein particle complex subunit 11
LLDTTRPSSGGGKTQHERTMSVTGNLRVSWRHKDGDAQSITSTIPVSPFVLPPHEPRVISTATSISLPTEPPTTKTPLSLIVLTLENPSVHPLTFDITTPSVDSLAFSGPKQLAVTVLPYSRTDVSYRVLPLIKVGSGAWLEMGVKVMDRYFQRVVDVLPGEGVSAAEGGVVRWYVA